VEDAALAGKIGFYKIKVSNKAANAALLDT